MKSDTDMISGFARGVRWVWLDLDDTLLDFHAASRASLRALYEAEGLDAHYPSVEAWTEAYEAHNRTLWERYARAEITQDFLRVDRFFTPLRPAWGGTEDELVAWSRRLDPLYLAMLADNSVLIPGARELLTHLRAHGYKIGILSNGFADIQHRKLAVTGLDALIDLTVLSDDIGVNKPDVRLYRHAMERAGEPSAAAHLMVGDNAATDILGASRAGWRHVLFDRSLPAATPPAVAGNSLVTPSLLALLRVFQP